ncbi:MAG: glycosyltransferase family 2 protein [Gemmatimonadaceae bacterium]
MTIVFLALAALQLLALVVVLVRLAPGYRRVRPVPPMPGGLAGTSVTVIVPTRNEASRLGPCLDALRREGDPLREVLVVDGESTDDTRALVDAVARQDGRFHLVAEPALPSGWIGKVWALQHGLSLAQGEWVLGVDADTEGERGFVAGVVAAARAHDLQLVSFSPRFDGQTAGERWLQPSMLMTLIYRVGAPTSRPAPERVMANGQCFLARRDILQAHGGYQLARGSFADDVTLAREYAKRGVRVGFLDGRALYRVRAYRNARQMWREWGRSFDLSDATAPGRQWLDVCVILGAQGVAWPLFLALSITGGSGTGLRALAWWTSGALVLVRVLMNAAIAESYVRRGWAFWLSPLSDPAAAVRLVWSTVRRPNTWRERVYRLEQ